MSNVKLMLPVSMLCVFFYVSVRPTIIETAVYVNSIGPVDPINMVRLGASSDLSVYIIEYIQSSQSADIYLLL